MTEVGKNGAAASTLNNRFIKCSGCNVNIPKETMLELGKCSICGQLYEAPSDNSSYVQFDSSQTEAPKKVKKRWVALESKRGRIYYHNTETGEDRWDKPADIDAEASEDAFVPFKNDAVKKAVLREQNKMEASRMGLPAHVVDAMQAQAAAEDAANDPLNRLTQRSDEAETATTPISPRAESGTTPGSPATESKDSSCLLM